MQPEPRLIQPEAFTVFLARHATPERARPDLPYHIPPGPALTERGLQEAAELGAFLRDAGVARMFASPLERAWRTATIASEITQASLELDTDLAEWRPDEVEKKVTERIWRSFERAARLSAETGPVTIVTHGGPVMLLLKALGLPDTIVQRYRVFDSRNPIPMAGAWRIERAQNGDLYIQLVFGPNGVKLPTVTNPKPTPGLVF